MLNNNTIPLGIILGSGIEIDEEIISGKQVFSVDISGIHKKTLFKCSIRNKEVLVFKGRKHFYEGWGYDEIILNIKTAAAYGVKHLLITNAAGGLNPNFEVGDLMLITSCINFNPKICYKKDPKLNSAFLKDKFRKACALSKVKLQEGTYGYYQGPTYETRAEIRMQKKYALDAAGMSTVPELFEAAKLGMAAIAVSVITNLLNENNSLPANHDEVVANALKASALLNKCLPYFINELN